MREMVLMSGWTGRTAITVMVVVWTVSVVSSLPTAMAFRVTLVDNDLPLDVSSTPSKKPFCFPTYPVIAGTDTYSLYTVYTTSTRWSLYTVYLVTVQYFLPLIIICIAYARVMYRIWFAKAPGSAVDGRDKAMNRNKKKVIKMLIIVVALFALCWLPLQLYNLLAIIAPEVNWYRYINIIWFCCNWLAMSNSCYNPFIYGLVNEKFKNGFRQLFRRSPCRVICRGGTAGSDVMSTTVGDELYGGSGSSNSARVRNCTSRTWSRQPVAGRCGGGAVSLPLPRSSIDLSNLSTRAVSLRLISDVEKCEVTVAADGPTTAYRYADKTFTVVVP